jgi:hypothetical protein
MRLLVGLATIASTLVFISLAHAEGEQADASSVGAADATAPAPSTIHATAPTPPADLGTPPTIESDTVPSTYSVTTRVPRQEQRLAVQGVLELLGGPTGIIGVLVDYTPNRWFAVTAGAGMGGALHPQFAASARLRLPIGDHIALGAGAGVSGGAYTPFLQGFMADGEYEEVTYANVLWGNPELSFEAFSSSGFFFRAFAGDSVALAVGSTSCVQHSGGSRGPSGPCLHDHDRPSTLPYVSLAFGASFSL